MNLIVLEEKTVLKGWCRGENLFKCLEIQKKKLTCDVRV